MGFPAEYLSGFAINVPPLLLLVMSPPPTCLLALFLLDCSSAGWSALSFLICLGEEPCSPPYSMHGPSSTALAKMS